MHGVHGKLKWKVALWKMSWTQNVFSNPKGISIIHKKGILLNIDEFVTNY